MRRQSKTRAAKDRKCKGQRTSYKLNVMLCHVCNAHPCQDVHEIARGVHREAAYCNPIAWLAVCRHCHELLGDYSEYPLPRQLAIKLCRDPQNFDLIGFNRLRGRADNAITLAEVAAWLQPLEG